MFNQHDIVISLKSKLQSLAYNNICNILFPLHQESKYNPEEFPPNFIKGVAEGFWWSFISMTTVG